MPPTAEAELHSAREHPHDLLIGVTVRLNMGNSHEIYGLYRKFSNRVLIRFFAMAVTSFWAPSR